MTHIAFKNRPVERSFNNLIDDFLPNFSSLLYDNNIKGYKNMPVNINEKEAEYVIDVVAPGFEKGDFKINLDNNLLTISAEVKKEEEDKNEKTVRREYSFSSFKRTFSVDEKIDAENIAAKYINGVLSISLPKKVEVKTSTKEISIL
jgi:HSP20 family protein